MVVYNYKYDPPQKKRLPVVNEMGEWVIIHEAQMSHLAALSRREQATLRWDDGRSVLEQHDELYFASVSLNKPQEVESNVAPLIILAASQIVFVCTP